jgi:hypothetical protein
MAEQEVNLEHLDEVIKEGGKGISWSEKVALTTTILAVLAAMSNMLSTHQSDRSILYKIEASNRWAYYQAKGLKAMLSQVPEEKSRYKEEQGEIQAEAEEYTRESNHALHVHEFFAFAVTLFQVATAVGAIAVLVRKKYFWTVSLLLGAVGLAFATKAFLLFLK